uniref:Unspecific monooxygenase n=1 Tax=Opuntia streptacantha TaxID=393608 RepID=A0A7C9F1G6_OPUST
MSWGLTLFTARQDTTVVTVSWFFYLLSKNPNVLSKLKDKLGTMILQVKHHHGNDKIVWGCHSILSRNFEELTDKLSYLHAAILEALRLYPTVALNAKAPAEVDILPSGHQADPSLQIIFDLYAVGRMKIYMGRRSL